MTCLPILILILSDKCNVVLWLRASPLLPAMSFKDLVDFVYQPSAGPGAEEMEPGNAESPVLPVEQVNPLVQLDQLVLPVPMVGGKGAIVCKPDHFKGTVRRKFLFA